MDNGMLLLLLLMFVLPTPTHPRRVVQSEQVATTIPKQAVTEDEGKLHIIDMGGEGGDFPVRHRQLPISTIWELVLFVLNTVLGWFGLPQISPDPEPPEPTPAGQSTPNPADWSNFYSKVNTDHTPDGVPWLDPEDWVSWDGTVYEPKVMGEDDFFDAICTSGGNTIRGLRDLFYEHNPFADIKQPTKAEVDEWHRLSLDHLRALVGIDHPAIPDHCLFARALWGQERRHSTKWDQAYPDNTCVGDPNSHCGHSFLPDPEDQIPYLPEGHPPCGLPGGAEGVNNAPKSNIPWGIKWVRGFCAYLGAEGYNGSHVAPFFRREKFGFSFFDEDDDKSNSNADFRVKWSGKSIPLPWE